MTAQHNAALNSAARPQDLLALQQRRQLSTPAPPDLVRPPPPPPVVPQSPQGEPPKLQYSPRATVPLQHRPGTFYGHNPNLKRNYLFSSDYVLWRAFCFLFLISDWQDCQSRNVFASEETYQKISYLLTPVAKFLRIIMKKKH